MNYFIKIFLFVLLFQSCKKDSGNDNDLPQTDEYVTWKIDTIDVKLTSPNMLATFFWDRPSNSTMLGGYYNVTKQNLVFVFAGNKVAGTYYADPRTFLVNNDSLNYFGIDNKPAKIIVSKYGATGDFIMGSFSGSVRDFRGADHWISGYFKIRTE